jgi:hypothetical protein
LKENYDKIKIVKVQIPDFTEKCPNLELSVLEQMEDRFLLTALCHSITSAEFEWYVQNVVWFLNGYLIKF